MNMKQLRYVLVLAHEGSFSRAADSLNITQPSLSQYIKKIEKELGVELFDRSGGDVRITDAGRIYIEVGRKILDLEKQMERKFEDLSQYRTGSIVIGLSPNRCLHLMPEVVRRFQQLYPGMHLVLEERVGASLLDDAEHGQFDLCIATLPVNEKVFCCRPMMREEVILAVNRNTELFRRLERVARKTKNRLHPAVDFRELDGERMVTLYEEQPTQKALDQICASTGIRVRNAVECRSIESQFAMIKAGIGTGLVPSVMSKFSSAEQIAFFSFVESVPYRDIAVIYRRGQYLSRATEDLIGILTGLDA